MSLPAAINEEVPSTPVVDDHATADLHNLLRCFHTEHQVNVGEIAELLMDGNSNVSIPNTRTKADVELLIKKWWMKRLKISERVIDFVSFNKTHSICNTILQQEESALNGCPQCKHRAKERVSKAYTATVKFGELLYLPTDLESCRCSCAKVQTRVTNETDETEVSSRVSAQVDLELRHPEVKRHWNALIQHSLKSWLATRTQPNHKSNIQSHSDSSSESDSDSDSSSSSSSADSNSNPNPNTDDIGDDTSLRSEQITAVAEYIQFKVESTIRAVLMVLEPMVQQGLAIEEIWKRQCSGITTGGPGATAVRESVFDGTEVPRGLVRAVNLRNFKASTLYCALDDCGISNKYTGAANDNCSNNNVNMGAVPSESTVAAFATVAADLNAGGTAVNTCSKRGAHKKKKKIDDSDADVSAVRGGDVDQRGASAAGLLMLSNTSTSSSASSGAVTAARTTRVSTKKRTRTQSDSDRDSDSDYAIDSDSDSGGDHIRSRSDRSEARRCPPGSRAPAQTCNANTVDAVPPLKVQVTAEHIFRCFESLVESANANASGVVPSRAVLERIRRRLNIK